MWLVASTFIIPDLLSLAQIIIIARGERSKTDAYTFVLFFVNPCVEIIGMLFSTVWAAKNHWQVDSRRAQPQTISLRLVESDADGHARGSAGAVPGLRSGARADVKCAIAQRYVGS